MAQTTEPTTQVQLPLRALLAFASRCARRVQSHFHVSDGDEEATIHLAAIENAIRLTEQFAAGAEISSDVAADAEEQAISALLHVKQRRPDDDRSAYAANAAYAAINATRSAIELRDGGGDELAHGVWDSVQIVGDAARLADETVERGALFDLEMLACLRLGKFPSLGDPIDPSEKGLLGPLQRRAKRRSSGSGSGIDPAGRAPRPAPAESSSDTAVQSSPYADSQITKAAVDAAEAERAAAEQARLREQAERNQQATERVKRSGQKLAALKKNLRDQQLQLERERLQLEQQQAEWEASSRSEAAAKREPSDSVLDEDDARERAWQCEKENLEKHVFSLQQELASATAARAEAQAAWQADREALEAKLAEGAAAVDAIKELDGVREQLARREQEAETTAEHISHLEKQLKSEQELAGRHWEQAEQAREQLQQLRDEVEQSRQPLDEERQALEALRAELEQREELLRSEEASLRQRFDNLSEAEASLAEQREQLQAEAQALSDRAEAVQKERVEVNRRKKSLDARAEKLKERAEVQKHRHAVLKKRQTALDEQQAAFQAIIDQIEAEKAELAAREQRVSELEAELENDRKTLQVAKADLKTDRENLQQAMDEFARQKNEEHNIAEELERLREQLCQEKESLWETAAAMQARRERLEAEFIEITARNSELLEEQARLELNISQLRQGQGETAQGTGEMIPLLSRSGKQDQAPIHLIIRPGLAEANELRDLFGTFVRLYHGLSGWSLKYRVRDCRLCQVDETIEWNELTEVERGVVDVELTPYAGEDLSRAGKFDVHRWVQFRSCLLMVLRLEGELTHVYAAGGASHIEHEAANILREAIDQLDIPTLTDSADALVIDRMNECLARADVAIQQLRRRCRTRMELATQAALVPPKAPTAAPAEAAPPQPAKKGRKSRKWGLL